MFYRTALGWRNGSRTVCITRECDGEFVRLDKSVQTISQVD